MKALRQLSIAGGIVLMTVAFAAAQSAKLEKTHIAVAVGGSISQMNKVAYTMALHRKYFEQEGLTVDSSAFSSGTAALQSLIGGSADVAEGAFEHTLRLQTKGVGLTCLATFGRYPGNVLVVRKSEAGKIRSVKDLVGKKIGISAPGASTQNFVAGLMSRAGVDWKASSYISIGTGPSAVAAMRSGGELDALVNLDPAISSLADSDDVVVLSDSRTEGGTKDAFGGPYLADCLMVKNDFLKANPNTSQAIANAIVHAMQWMMTASVDDIIKSLPSEYYKSDEKTYRKSLEKNLSAFQWNGIVSNEAAQNVWDSIAVLEPSLKEFKIDVTATHDNRLIEAALKKYHTPVKD